MRFGQWDKLKSDARQIPASLSQDCHTHIYNINKRMFQRDDQCPTTQEVVMISRLVTASSKLTLNKGHYIEMMMDFLAYVGSNDKALQKTIAEASAPFMDRINYPEKFRSERLRQRIQDINAYVPDPYPEYNDPEDPALTPPNNNPPSNPISTAVALAQEVSTAVAPVKEVSTAQLQCDQPISIHSLSFNQLHHSSRKCPKIPQTQPNGVIQNTENQQYNKNGARSGALKIPLPSKHRVTINWEACVPN